MGSAIHFWFRNRVIEIVDAPSTLSVLEWLREYDGSRGTKEGCNQGDCGACMVAVATLGPEGLELTTANSCLLVLGMLHGRALFTIEDVGSPEAMHPVQQAMVDNAGSQCGFCTPGFVMSMWCMTENGARCGAMPAKDELTDGLSGNLCRCTGYRPIVDAVVQAGEAVERTSVSAVDWDAIAAHLRTLADSLDAGCYLAPASEDVLAQTLAARPHARIIAGGTDLIVSLRASGGILDDGLLLVSTAAIPSLSMIEVQSDRLVLGSAVSLERAWRELASRCPDVTTVYRRFASASIRSMGTIGGNIANASPIADLVPVLIALDAEIELRSTKATRRVMLADFATGVRTTILEPGEYIARIEVPLGSFDRRVHAYKVSRRFDDDISSVSAVFAMCMQGDDIAELRMVFGGMATTVRRAQATERAVMEADGSAQSEATVNAALAVDFSPIDDHRASGKYRRLAAQGLVKRWWLDRQPAEFAHDMWAVR